jgi:hypothetical protein
VSEVWDENSKESLILLRRIKEMEKKKKIFLSRYSIYLSFIYLVRIISFWVLFGSEDKRVFMNDFGKNGTFYKEGFFFIFRDLALFWNIWVSLKAVSISLDFV